MSAAFASQRVPSAEGSNTMLAAALAEATLIGVRVNIAVVDSGGNLSGFLRMPGAFLSSMDLAIDKAFCAASFGMTTRRFGEYLETAPRAVRDGLLRRPRLTEVPGGLPIEIGGEAIGAIGVSGASDEQDEAVATAGLNALAQLGNDDGLRSSVTDGPRGER